MLYEEDIFGKVLIPLTGYSQLHDKANKYARQRARIRIRACFFKNVCSAFLSI